MKKEFKKIIWISVSYLLVFLALVVAKEFFSRDVITMRKYEKLLDILNFLIDDIFMSRFGAFLAFFISIATLIIFIIISAKLIAGKLMIEEKIDNNGNIITLNIDNREKKSKILLNTISWLFLTLFIILFSTALSIIASLSGKLSF